MKKMLVLVSVICATTSAVYGFEARGVIIYSEPPSNFVQGCEYAAYTRNSGKYYSILRADGRKVEIRADSKMEVIEYPPTNPDQSLLESANYTVSRIKALENQYPDFRAKLVVAESKWENAIQFLTQRSISSAAGGAKISFEYDGQKLQEVRLSSLNGEQIGITHSAGVGKLDLNKLSKPQIKALNSTSTTVQIDPEWKQKQLDAQKKAEEAKRKAEEGRRIAEDKKRKAEEVTKQGQANLKDLEAKYLEAVRGYGSYYDIRVKRKLSSSEGAKVACAGHDIYEIECLGLSTLGFQRYDTKTGKQISQTGNVMALIRQANSIPKTAILITTETSFTSPGQARILATKQPPVEVEMENGFSQKVTVLMECSVDPVVETSIADMERQARELKGKAQNQR